MTDYYSETHFTLDWPPPACDYALRFKAALDQAANNGTDTLDETWKILCRRCGDPLTAVGFDLTRSDAGLKVSAPGFLEADTLATFIQVVLSEFNLPPVEFEWADYAYSNAPGAFGGGAAVVSRDKIVMMTTTDWLMQMKSPLLAEPTAAVIITTWLRQLQPNLPSDILAAQTHGLLGALHQSTLTHPAPGFLTTLIAQEINRKMKQVFDLLGQLDEAFKVGLPSSLATLNAALDLNAGHINGSLTYEQWLALYQPLLAGNQPRRFTRTALFADNQQQQHRQIWTLKPLNGAWNIYPGYDPDPAHTHFLTGVPWNNAALVVALDDNEVSSLQERSDG